MSDMLRGALPIEHCGALADAGERPGCVGGVLCGVRVGDGDLLCGRSCPTNPGCSAGTGVASVAVKPAAAKHGEDDVAAEALIGCCTVLYGIVAAPPGGDDERALHGRGLRGLPAV